MLLQVNCGDPFTEGVYQGSYTLKEVTDYTVLVFSNPQKHN